MHGFPSPTSHSRCNNPIQPSPNNSCPMLFFYNIYIYLPRDPDPISLPQVVKDILHAAVSNLPEYLLASSCPPHFPYETNTTQNPEVLRVSRLNMTWKGKKEKKKSGLNTPSRNARLQEMQFRTTSRKGEYRKRKYLTSR